MSGRAPAVMEAVMAQVRSALSSTDRRPVVIGLCGAQGSGKSTLAAAVEAACASEGLRAATLSLDDLYLTRAQRQALAREVHPLLATRGVPGTHDVALGIALLDGLQQGLALPLPRFDKVRDDRASPAEWPLAPENCDVLLFDGWCVGARPQFGTQLVAPVNALEADGDPQAIWRTYANDALARDYQALFARIDSLVLLAAPNFAVVQGWRLQQERELAARHPAGERVMDEAAIARFVAHYERLTNHILAEMPARADLVVRLDATRHALAIEVRP